MTNVSITGWLVTTSKCRLNQLKKYCKSVVQKQLIYIYLQFCDDYLDYFLKKGSDYFKA